MLKISIRAVKIRVDSSDVYMLCYTSIQFKQAIPRRTVSIKPISQTQNSIQTKTHCQKLLITLTLTVKTKYKLWKKTAKVKKMYNFSKALVALLKTLASVLALFSCTCVLKCAFHFQNRFQAVKRFSASEKRLQALFKSATSVSEEKCLQAFFLRYPKSVFYDSAWKRFLFSYFHRKPF